MQCSTQVDQYLRFDKQLISLLQVEEHFAYCYVAK